MANKDDNELVKNNKNIQHVYKISHKYSSKKKFMEIVVPYAAIEKNIDFCLDYYNKHTLPPIVMLGEVACRVIDFREVPIRDPYKEELILDGALNNLLKRLYGIDVEKFYDVWRQKVPSIGYKVVYLHLETKI